MPSAELPPMGTWEFGLYALHGPLVAWERTLVQGPFLPNPDDQEYENTLEYLTGRYPPTPNTDLEGNPLAQEFEDFYRMRQHPDRKYPPEGRPHHEGPTYYMHQPRLLALTPYVSVTANRDFQFSIQWYTFVSTERSDHRGGRQAYLQFPTLRFKWRILRQRGAVPALAAGFDYLRSNVERSVHERYLHLVVTWRRSNLTFSAGWVNLHFSTMGAFLMGLTWTASPWMAVAADWTWANWRAPDETVEETLANARNYMVASLALQFRHAGWTAELGWANGLGVKSQRDTFPVVRVAREMKWRSLFGVLYHDKE